MYSRRPGLKFKRYTDHRIQENASRQNPRLSIVLLSLMARHAPRRRAPRQLTLTDSSPLPHWPRLTSWLWLWLPIRRRDLAAEINTCLCMSIQSRSHIHCTIGAKSAALQTKETSLKDDFALERSTCAKLTHTHTHTCGEHHQRSHKLIPKHISKTL